MRQHIIISLLLFFLGPLPLLAAEPVPPKGMIGLSGKPAPPLKLMSMEGGAFDLKRSRGHWVFVHFWASWCGPCRKEMPTIQGMAQRLKDEDLEIILVNTAEDEDTVFIFLSTVAPELDKRTLLDSDGKVTELWQPRGLPSSFLVDPSGRLRYVALGGRVWDGPEYLSFLRGLIRHKPATDARQ